MKTFLKTKEITVDGETVTITQLSGLNRFDFLDFCSDLPKPIQPEKPSDDVTEQDYERYLEEYEKCLKKWQRINFTAQSRLVAYGYLEAGDDLEDRHQLVMSTMTPEQVKFMHDEIALFSGIPLPKEPEESTEPENEEVDKSEEQLEPVDPKG
ncbi:phage minor tail protein G [Vibrio cyclitrophicus]|uniref:Uncharacterized protein n=1 Tax=Vibrio sp. 1F_97 TaxID=1652827 RepID=A0A0H3ZTJ7_9VIBR|nr:phage minor tail protein G [Vibrio cyclitrophicus]AKN39673.1 hypothetical protein [Vibrio sp. 1F_97]OEF29264.1 hypothetical protein OA9_09915 [Vibrio cyclitrophicus 1F97]